MQAANVEQTLSAASQNVQAILLDTSLDGMNGWEILASAAPHGSQRSRTPVVLLSVEDPQTPAELPAGAEGWVAKPLQEDALLAELARVLCGPGEKARILIVEDDHDLARVISEVFARDSIVVQTAHSLQGDDRCLFRVQAASACCSISACPTATASMWSIGCASTRTSPACRWWSTPAASSRRTERRQLTLGPTYFLAKTRVQPQQLEALVLTMLRSARQTDETAAEMPAPKQ